MFTNICHVQLHRSAIPTVFSTTSLSAALVHEFLSPSSDASTTASLSSSMPSTSRDSPSSFNTGFLSFLIPSTSSDTYSSPSNTASLTFSIPSTSSDTSSSPSINTSLSFSVPSSSSDTISPLSFSIPLSSPTKRPCLDDLPKDFDLDPPSPKVVILEPENILATPRRSKEKGKGSRRRTPQQHKSSKTLQRMSLNRIVGVGKIQDPEVKKVARTAQQYRQMVHNIKYKLRLAQGKNRSLQRIAKQQFVDNVDELLISRGTRLLLKGELKNFKKKPRARKWTLEDKLFALAIYKRSPRAYRFLIQHVTLPSEGTLKNLLNDIPLEVGILKSVLTLLKSNAQKMKPSERHCVLTFDEVYLVPHLKAYKKKWTQPVAFFYVHKTCPSSMLRLLITDVVRAVRETGLNVLATVSDQGPTNRGAVAELKANSTNDDIFYSVDNVKMVHIYDIPHIFKNIRNNLLSSDLEYEPGKIAKWANIIEYFKLDESICSTSRLTYKHMNPQGKEKMKVKFAAETISQKVAKGMKTIHVVSDGRKLPTCMDTSSFLLIADQFFDLTNGASSSPAEQKNSNANALNGPLDFNTYLRIFLKNIDIIHQSQRCLKTKS
ncbi:Transposable element P transposase [Frankliniella fusca]|uniref:Transposable element P transposase n=1 Tax=Frankliniella fusca TaxID=407009 RepID=A0AAE1HMD3_9NEOP|nr:Transposable element P transposase [Frankliniella fusca]